MGYDVFTKRKDRGAPRWSQCYELVSQLLEGRDGLRLLFEAPVEIVNHQEIRRFDHDDSRLETAAMELGKLLQGYSPTHKFEGVRVEPPFPAEIMDGAAFSLKQVIDYARKHKVKLFIDG